MGAGMKRNTGRISTIVVTLFLASISCIVLFLMVNNRDSLELSLYYFACLLAALAIFSVLLSRRLHRFTSDTESFIEENRNHDIESLSNELKVVAEEVRHLKTDDSDSTTIADEINKLSSKFDAWSKQFEQLLSKDSSKHLSTEYDAYAESEKHMAIAYDIIAVILSTAGATIALVSSFNDSAFGPWALVTRATMVIGTFTASGLVFKRGTFHHKEAKAAMRTALTLSQYRNFTANLPDNIKDVIEVEIAQRVFSKGEIDHADERIADIFCRRGVTVSELSDLIKLLKSMNVD